MAKIQNTKDLLQHAFQCMEDLSGGKITVDQAREQSNLIKQSNNLLRFELDRVQVLMKLQDHKEIHGDTLFLREIEEKPIQNIRYS
jgi:DnaJ-domain-containing protein 1